MTDVADISPGTVLVSGTSGWSYRVQGVDQDSGIVILLGPHGSLSAGYESIQRGIANGKIGVEG